MLHAWDFGCPRVMDKITTWLCWSPGHAHGEMTIFNPCRGRVMQKGIPRVDEAVACVELRSFNSSRRVSVLEQIQKLKRMIDSSLDPRGFSIPGTVCWMSEFVQGGTRGESSNGGIVSAINR